MLRYNFVWFICWFGIEVSHQHNGSRRVLLVEHRKMFNQLDCLEFPDFFELHFRLHVCAQQYQFIFILNRLQLQWPILAFLVILVETVVVIHNSKLSELDSHHDALIGVLVSLFVDAVVVRQVSHRLELLREVSSHVDLRQTQYTSIVSLNYLFDDSEAIFEWDHVDMWKFLRSI